MDNYWINLDNYTPEVLILFGLGSVFWVIAYIIVIKRAIRDKFVEIPWFVVAVNFAWEFMWSFPLSYLVSANIGQLFVWGYRAWFFLDIVIVWNTIKYGDKQLTVPMIKKIFKPVFIITVFVMGVFIYTFTITGYDTNIGTITAYLDNFSISILYIFLFWKIAKPNLFSYQIAWFKMFGTGITTISLCMHWPDNYFLYFIGTAIFIIDCYYIYIFKKPIES